MLDFVKYFVEYWKFKPQVNYLKKICWCLVLNQEIKRWCSSGGQKQAEDHVRVSLLLLSSESNSLEIVKKRLLLGKKSTEGVKSTLYVAVKSLAESSLDARAEVAHSESLGFGNVSRCRSALYSPTWEDHRRLNLAQPSKMLFLFVLKKKKKI